ALCGRRLRPASYVVLGATDSANGGARHQRDPQPVGLASTEAGVISRPGRGCLLTGATESGKRPRGECFLSQPRNHYLHTEPTGIPAAKRATVAQKQRGKPVCGGRLLCTGRAISQRDVLGGDSAVLKIGPRRSASAPRQSSDSPDT